MRGILMIVIIGMAWACSPNRVFEQAESLPKQQWAYGDTIWVEATIPDTTSTYDLYLAIRHNQEYPFSNLWIHLQTFYPSGKAGLLKKELLIGNNEAQSWETDCLQDICNGLLPIVEGITFSEKGEVRFALTHIMRTNPLPGIMDVGLRIERQP